MTRPDAAVAHPGARPWRVGLDVGGTKIEGVLLDGEDEVRAVVRTATEPGPDGVLRTCVRVVDRLVGHLDPGEAEPSLRIGVGVPGVVDHRRGIVASAVNLAVGPPFPFGPRLAAATGATVVVENDVDVAALGAGRLLGLGGDFAYLSLGTGVAAGLVLDGALRRGAGGVAGEVGHLVHRPDGPVCACGQRGCIEAYASGRALDRAWATGGPDPAPVDLFRRAAAGETAAVAARDVFADAVAAAVTALVLVAGVGQVVLGGGVAALGPPLLDAVAAASRRRARGSAFLGGLEIPRRLVLAPAGRPVAAVGAAFAGSGAAAADVG